MKRVRLALLGILIMGLVNGCAVVPPVAEKPTQPEIIELQITPAVEHWLLRVAACAEGIPDFGIYTQILPRNEVSLDESDLILRLGERLESDPYVAVMGTEKIVVVAGEDVPVSSLSMESLQALYAGEINRWSDVPETEDGGAAPITLMAYPEGHEIETLFTRAYLNDEPVAAAAQTFSTVDFLQKLLEMYPTAIGYLLESQVPEGMRTLVITDDQPIPSLQYLLAITAQEPQGRLKALLTCLQNAQ